MDPKSRRVLVTGGSRGLGRAIALKFAHSGYTVALTYHKNEDLASNVIEEIRSTGANAHAFQLSVESWDSVTDLARQLEKGDLQPDILVNNAGAILRPGGWLEQSPKDMLRTVEINLLGTIYAMRAFVPQMANRKWGRVINLATTYAFNGATAVLAYTSAKAGVISATKAVAAEVGDKGVTVNAIAPGNFDTEMTRSAGEGVLKWTLDTTPAGRLGQPEEVARVAQFLAENEFITGQVLCVDGGQLLRI